MKHFSLSLTLVLLVLGVPAQSPERSSYSELDPAPHSIGLQSGIGRSFGLSKEDLNFDLTVNDSVGPYTVNLYSLPDFGVVYDYRIDRRFSLGVAYTYQQIKLSEFKLRQGGVEPDGGGPQKLNVNRSFFSLRGLIHYGPNHRLEMYGGLRFGWTLFGFRDWEIPRNTDIDFEFLEDQTIPREGLRLQHIDIIPFGFRGYINKYIYAGAETMLGFGSSHFIAAQVGYRF